MNGFKITRSNRRIEGDVCVYKKTYTGSNALQTT